MPSAKLRAMEKELAAYKKVADKELARLTKAYGKELAKLMKSFPENRLLSGLKQASEIGFQEQINLPPLISAFR
jgi:hypothetical protein